MNEKELLNNIIRDHVDAETMAYVLSNFKRVGEEDTDNRIWTSIHAAGNDEKYGRTMVCIETKEIRTTTFSEFYCGPGVYDYTVPRGTWCRHGNHTALQKYLIPDTRDRFDFKQYPITLGYVD